MNCPECGSKMEVWREILLCSSRDSCTQEALEVDDLVKIIDKQALEIAVMKAQRGLSDRQATLVGDLTQAIKKFQKDMP